MLAKRPIYIIEQLYAVAARPDSYGEYAAFCCVGIKGSFCESI